MPAEKVYIFLLFYTQIEGENNTCRASSAVYVHDLQLFCFMTTKIIKLKLICLNNLLSSGRGKLTFS